MVRHTPIRAHVKVFAGGCLDGWRGPPFTHRV